MQVFSSVCKNLTTPFTAPKPHPDASPNIATAALWLLPPAINHTYFAHIYMQQYTAELPQNLLTNYNIMGTHKNKSTKIILPLILLVQIVT
jgi:hypothetical protein